MKQTFPFSATDALDWAKSDSDVGKKQLRRSLGKCRR